MKPKSLLKPIKYLDEQVLRHHTKIAKFIEDKKGINKNTQSDILSSIVIGVGLVYSVVDEMITPSESIR